MERAELGLWGQADLALNPGLLLGHRQCECLFLPSKMGMRGIIIPPPQ